MFRDVLDPIVTLPSHVFAQLATFVRDTRQRLKARPGRRQNSNRSDWGDRTIRSRLVQAEVVTQLIKTSFAVFPPYTQPLLPVRHDLISLAAFKNPPVQTQYARTESAIPLSRPVNLPGSEGGEDCPPDEDLTRDDRTEDR